MLEASAPSGRGNQARTVPGAVAVRDKPHLEDGVDRLGESISVSRVVGAGRASRAVCTVSVSRAVRFIGAGYAEANVSTEEDSPQAEPRISQEDVDKGGHSRAEVKATEGSPEADTSLALDEETMVSGQAGTVHGCFPPGASVLRQTRGSARVVEWP